MKKKIETISEAIILALRQRIHEVEKQKRNLMPNYTWMVECDEKLKVLNDLLNAFLD